MPESILLEHRKIEYSQDIAQYNVLSFSKMKIHLNGGRPSAWGCRKYRLHLCRRLRLPHNVCPGYDSKQSDDEEFGRMRSSPSLPLLPGLLWPGVVSLERVLSMSQIELFDIPTVCKHIIC